MQSLHSDERRGGEQEEEEEIGGRRGGGNRREGDKGMKKEALEGMRERRTARERSVRHPYPVVRRSMEAGRE